MGAAADQAQAYADLMGSTTSLVNATASILKEAGKAPDATAPLVSEAQEGLTSGRDGLSAASTAAEKALAAADASYDAVTRAADEAFATMKDNPAAAQGVLAACRSDVQGLAQAYQTMRDTVAGADPAPLTASSPSWARWRRTSPPPRVPSEATRRPSTRRTPR